MIYTNDDSYGGPFLGTVKNEIRDSSDVYIASGYVSDDIITQFEKDLCAIAKKGGLIRLLIGMAFYEGLSEKNLKHLQQIEGNLQEIGGGSGIFVCFTRRFHGKIYSFRHPNREKHIYVGSSNFSRSGLAGNLECTVRVEDLHTQKRIENYLGYLFSPANAVSILKADIVPLGSKEYQDRLKLETLSDLTRYDPGSINTKALKYFDYPLDRAVSFEKSNLNVYFGKGRWARTTGKVTPRPWYEIELIAPNDINSNPLYPKGDFFAYTDDGYIIAMKTSGDYFKNIRSKDSLQIFGQWIKGKLQKAGALIPLTPVTQETLDKYGTDKIRFYKIKEGEYYMGF